MQNVDSLMNQAIAEEIFPGGVLLVSKEGETVFSDAYGVAHLTSRVPVSPETIFDLASLTKPLATTLAVMWLVQHNQIKLEQHLGQLLPEFEHTDKARIKLEHLLYHNSGLPDYRPYYKALNGVATDSRRKALRQHLVQEPCINPVGQTVLYSDLGFMILAWAVWPGLSSTLRSSDSIILLSMRSIIRWGLTIFFLSPITLNTKGEPLQPQRIVPGAEKL
jgi:CubicO group peptidase (beta-lactamase class C family)